MRMGEKIMTIRKIIRIDEEKCTGCEQCVQACAEGAIKIVDGKAKLVSEAYCDGLGVCLGECPEGAITIEEREAEEFNPEAVQQHLVHSTEEHSKTGVSMEVETDSLPCGCPSSTSQILSVNPPSPHSGDIPGEEGILMSLLSNWPVQIRLVAVNAPFFEKAKLLISADCVPFAFADFHRRFLSGHTLLVGCPKLDDAEFYKRKLAQIFSQNDIQSIEVVYMEVPCCFGLVELVRQALDESEKKIPLTLTQIGRRGTIQYQILTKEHKNLQFE
jgi:Pyruvate/2-oxoacid:ferredoxin oxidoreductase delta subunit